MAGSGAIIARAGAGGASALEFVDIEVAPDASSVPRNALQFIIVGICQSVPARVHPVMEDATGTICAALKSRRRFGLEDSKIVLISTFSAPSATGYPAGIGMCLHASFLPELIKQERHGRFQPIQH